MCVYYTDANPKRCVLQVEENCEECGRYEAASSDKPAEDPETVEVTADAHGDDCGDHGLQVRHCGTAQVAAGDTSLPPPDFAAHACAGADKGEEGAWGMAATQGAAVRVIGRTPYCPDCGLRMLAREDYYYCVLCGREWVPGPEWVGDVWADEMRYKYSIAHLKGGSRKAGRKRSSRKKLPRRDAIEGIYSVD